MHVLRILLFIPALLACGQVAALPCGRPNFAREFNTINAGVTEYYLALGKFNHQGALPKIPELSREDRFTRSDVIFRFEFDGRLFVSSGLSDKKQIPVWINVVCRGIWCGKFPQSDTKFMAFLKVNDDEYPVLMIDPCGFLIHLNPDPEQILAIQRCMLKNVCQRTEFLPFER